jgi:uncharacterized membrane protein HdeD (DUF308 family)
MHHIESEVTMESFVERVSQMADADLKRVRWALGINGVLSLALGVIILVWPDISLFALTILFGVFTLATGVVGFGAAISGPMKEGRGWLIVSSLLSIAVGIVVLVWPSISALALLYVIGAYAIALRIITIGGRSGSRSTQGTRRSSCSGAFWRSSSGSSVCEARRWSTGAAHRDRRVRTRARSQRARSRHRRQGDSRARFQAGPHEEG